MKWFLLFLIVILAGGGWFFLHGDKGGQNITIEPAVAHPDASNATFDFEDGPITLKNGSVSNDFGDTSLTDDVAYGDINGDGKNDTVAILMQSGGGSGTFIYLAAYVSGNVTYKGSNAVFIGDRVSPQSLSINKSVITLKYLDRKPDEPMAAEPTVSVTKTYIYKANLLEER